MGTCKYCGGAAERERIMTFVRDFPSGTLYLLRDQTLPGRCIFASKPHVKKLTDLDMDTYNQFWNDIYYIAHALTRLFRPDKINYLILGDNADHLHVHIVPKYRDKADWGSVFVLDRDEPMLLNEDGYTNITARINEELARNGHRY